ncbi:SPOR domain-containing protein [Methylocaldum szegediense]|uniref:SPOR domain-containing protein n=1 Tax=Methylocaldum szegediense TaxID=73780 RepID=UPI0012EB4693|nr:hypothetical protein [Methylocaldum szegediense]
MLLRERKDLPEKNADVDLAEVSATAAKSEQAKEIAQSLKEIAPMDAPSVPMLATVPNCFQWGPVTDETRARGILEQVKVRSNEASLVKKPSALTDGWWVLFPKAHDMDTANSNRKMLLEKGVTDLWLFDKGPLQGAISLGLFKTRVRAEQAQKKFTDQGIITEVVPRQVPRDAYWVRIPWTGPTTDLDELLKATARQSATGMSASLIPCD